MIAGKSMFGSQEYKYVGIKSFLKVVHPDSDADHHHTSSIPYAIVHN